MLPPEQEPPTTESAPTSGNTQSSNVSTPASGNEGNYFCSFFLFSIKIKPENLQLTFSFHIFKLANLLSFQKYFTFIFVRNKEKKMKKKKMIYFNFKTTSHSF